MKNRILTAALAIPIVVGIVTCMHPAPIWVAVGLTMFLCMAEAEFLFDQEFNPVATFAALALLLSAGVLSYTGDRAHLIAVRNFDPAPVIGGAAALWVGGMIAAWQRAKGAKGIFETALSACWYGVPLAALLLMHPISREEGFHWSFWTPLFMVLVPVWAGDTAAMLCGRAFGKHLLAPKISPKKTWEGAIGNFLASTAAGWLVGLGLGFPSATGFLCGAAVGVFGQFGDLFESAIKRAVGKKDSGDLLPGHGGFLDRLDAMLGAVIPVWAILSLSGSL